MVTLTLLDFAALGGLALAAVWVLRLLLRKDFSPSTVAMCGFALLMALLGREDAWSEVYAFGRTLTPLVLLLALTAFRERRLAPALPFVLVTPRIAIQFGPLAVQIAKGVLGR
jgi:UDP-N-acetylmuramyl pentapeptide phosphotransferase/UDP-N-acetylglucosamine-1-phosphate transferase